MRANRTYRLSLDVTVEDHYADDPDNEGHVIADAIARAKEMVELDEAEWWVDELPNQFEVIES